MTPNQMQMQIDLTKTTGVKCSECSSHFFDQTVIIRKVSRLYSGTPEDQITLVPVFVCRSCGTPLKELFPTGMSDVEADLGLVKKESIQLFQGQ